MDTHDLPNDRNITLQAALPSGLVCVASRQLSGRGRGGNTWLSPAGCLQFSLLLRMPSSHASKIVFVQYLFGLAVVEAIRSEPGFDQVGKRIRLKWPNDIYADMGVERGEEARWQKIGGILVNSSYAGSDFNLVIGMFVLLAFLFALTIDDSLLCYRMEQVVVSIIPMHYRRLVFPNSSRFRIHSRHFHL